MYPERIVCLTEEPTEVLYALGEEDRIVGITNFTVRPARARREKPRVSAFTSAHIDRILDLRPDLVIGFSDIQADIARDLIKEGVEVWISNHRDIEGIIGYVRRLGAMVGAAEEANDYASGLQAHVDEVRTAAAGLPHRPRVYFEEWNDPIITGIGWVAEVIRTAGGDDVFPELSTQSLARDRIIADPATVLERSPDLILASWCGKKVQFDHIYQRPGWEAIPALANGRVHEIDSSIILQPGPAAITDGLDEVHRLVVESLG
jgi:iron complex transport system substrate-binding protein